MSIYLITGATSGLGLQVALQIARQGRHRLILPLRDAARAAALRARLSEAGAADVSTPLLDLASLRSVAAFIAAFDEEHRGAAGAGLDGVLFNAGSQSASRIDHTVDGFETTFAVNHLAHFFLFEGLLRHLASSVKVGWTTSGVHDPKEPAARFFGFRGGRYTSVKRLAAGEIEAGTSVAQACRDAYATSKLCNVVTARAFASLHAGAATFFSFDPGLMPGTGLARQHGSAARWMWRNVLPRVAALLPGTSTPEKSAAVLSALLMGGVARADSGGYFRHSGLRDEPAALATERWVGDDLLQGSRALLEPFMRERTGNLRTVEAASS